MTSKTTYTTPKVPDELASVIGRNNTAMLKVAQPVAEARRCIVGSVKPGLPDFYGADESGRRVALCTIGKT